MTYEEARRKLERAVEKTDLESDTDRNKASRRFRKRKIFDSSSENESDENPTKARKSQSTSQTDNISTSFTVPTFHFSPLLEETGNNFTLFIYKLRFLS